MDDSIYKRLKRLNTDGSYPLHMPGHKRNYKEIFDKDNLFSFDITEITGYDDLHEPEGMIRESMNFAKEYYGTQESYFLINSTTAGNLAAIAVLCNIGDKILIARNCHKSVYHAVELLGLDPVYVYPEISKEGICKPITKNQIEEIIIKDQKIKAAMIVSPTYEGNVSDIRGIAEVLHKKGIPLIVDEAHGAHFAYNENFPKSAVSQGADIVIQSLHKTLPSLTQTGILHLCTDCVSKQSMQKKLSIFQSSSPSYILMASIDHCIHSCANHPESFQQYIEMIRTIRGYLGKLEHLSLTNSDDIGKIVISTRGTNITGPELFACLRERYKIEPEMSELSYVIAMTSICDTKEGLLKFKDALFEIDAALEEQEEESPVFCWEMHEKVMKPEEASRRRKKQTDIKEAEGKVAAEFVYLYPPGIPILVPGERIKKETVMHIMEYEKNKMKVVGCNQGKINIIDERI